MPRFWIFLLSFWYLWRVAVYNWFRRFSDIIISDLFYALFPSPSNIPITHVLTLLRLSHHFISFFFYWGLIALQYCLGLCHVSTWVSHSYPYIPALPLPSSPPSHPSRLSQGTGLSPPGVWVCVCKSLQSCPTLRNSMTVAHQILYAWDSLGKNTGIGYHSSRGTSWPRDQTHISYVSCTGRWVPYH